MDTVENSTKNVSDLHEAISSAKSQAKVLRGSPTMLEEAIDKAVALEEKLVEAFEQIKEAMKSDKPSVVRKAYSKYCHFGVIGMCFCF